MSVPERGARTPPSGSAKKRPRPVRGPDWISPKTMMAAIEEQIVPVMLDRGWVREERDPSRRRGYRFGEFDFIRVYLYRFERLTIDFKNGDDLHINVHGVISEGNDSHINRHENLDTFIGSDERNFWKRLIDFYRRPYIPNVPGVERLGKVVQVALQEVEAIDAYLVTGVRHPKLRSIGVFDSGTPWADDMIDLIRTAPPRAAGGEGRSS